MKAQLQAMLSAAGSPLDDARMAQLEAYHALLLDWNTRMDLSNVPVDDMAMKHYADSLLVLKRGDWFPHQARLIDVGSGAGFPGLPLAIARPDLHCILLDAQKKRCEFLRAVVSELQLDHVEVLWQRAEDAARGKLRESCDIAVARALAPLPVLAEYLLPFVKPGGRMLCWKGPNLAAELDQAGKALKALGGTAGDCYELPLPELSHYVQAVDKVSKTPPKYPRRAGLPAKKPL